MTLKDILPYITGTAGALVITLTGLWAFYAGKIHGDREFGREVQRGEALERRCDTLEQALKEKDGALKEAAARADAAVRASELIADAFTEARRRRSGRSHET